MIPRHVLVGVLLFCGPFDADAARNVSLDQAGYKPQMQKFVFVSAPADSFRVHDAVTGAVRFSGRLELWRAVDPASGKAVRRGDFSSFQEKGGFRVVTAAGDSSERFSINDTVYVDAYRKALKGFYFQRCGVSLLQQQAGVYQHARCHALDGYFHSSTDSTGRRAAAGGWHDAGDYGKYVVNAGITVGTLLAAYEYFPSRFGQDDLNIPETGNGIPDILDEVRYELEWLLTMQRADGGVYCKLTREQFEGFIMPQNDNATRYLYQVASTATGDFAAVMGRAARVYLPFDAAFAQRCREAGIRAWSFLSANASIVPAGGFTNPAGTATGEYGDKDDADERLWAAAELFVTTGVSEYNTYFVANSPAGGMFGYAMSWQNVRTMAHLTYLRSQQAGTNETVRLQLRNALNSYCAAQVTRRDSAGYRVVLKPGEYWWGCNSNSLNAAILLLLGYEELRTTTFLDAAADQVHYILGANAHSLSFVTGIGQRYTRQPHHRPSASDGIAEPVPGLLAGGPDQYRDDPVLQALFTSTTPPALCYVDTMPSYASNEIAINWNAPLVFVLGYFNEPGATSVGESQGTILPEGIRLEQNYPNPFNPATTISFGLSSRSVVSLRVFDLMGREVETLASEELPAGYFTRVWRSGGVSSGVYFYRLTAGSRSETKKCVLLR